MDVSSELSDMSALSFRLVFSNLSSVDSDDISESLNDWEVLEFVSVHDNLSVFSLGIVGWINDFKVAHEHLFGIVLGDELIWESGINDNSVEVDFIVIGGELDFADFSVVVFAGSSGWASSVLSGGSWWHFVS